MAEVSGDPQRLVLRHAPASARGALAVLFALDERLGAIVRATREPLIGQMRLTWWRDALTALDEDRPAPAEPVLADVRRLLLTRGVAGAMLAPMTEGWMAILHDDFAIDGSVADYADLRGATLFAAAARLLGAPAASMLADAGRGWALGDLAANISSPSAATMLRKEADIKLISAFASKWDRSSRSIGLLALLIRLEIEAEDPHKKLGRVISFRLFGR